jgi:hypothetical protein
MLGSFSPLTFVVSTVRPSVFAVAVFFVVLVIPYVDTSIAPLEGALSVHFIFEPLAFILLTIGPAVNPFSRDIVILIFSFEVAAIRKHKLTLAILFTIFEMP